MLKTTTGVTAEGTYLSIQEAKNGFQCNCFCPVCNSPLVAKQGEKLSWHFAHASSSEMTDFCRESDAHLAKKLKIKKTSRLKVPPIYPILSQPDLQNYRDSLFVPLYGFDPSVGHDLQFDEMLLEKSMGDYIPDLIGVLNGRRYLIEVVVTHDITPEKLEKIRRDNLDCLKINVNKSGLGEEPIWIHASLKYQVDNLYEMSISNERLKYQMKDFSRLQDELNQEKKRFSNKTIKIIQGREEIIQGKDKIIQEKNETISKLLQENKILSKLLSRLVKNHKKIRIKLTIGSMVSYNDLAGTITNIDIDEENRLIVFLSVQDSQKTLKVFAEHCIPLSFSTTHKKTIESSEKAVQQDLFSI